MAALTLNALTADRVEALGLLTDLAMSEQGLALEFARANEKRLAFLAEDRAWIAWTGTHWSEACAATLAEMFYGAMIGEVLERAAKAGDRERAFHVERARALGRRGMRANVLALAQPALAVSRDAFDRDAEDLLNTPSGIVDLRTGAVAPCDPARRLTQCTAVGYDASAPDPERFVEVVSKLAGDDAETFDWLLRALGYTITGRAHEDVAFFLRGPGGNGKSTLLRAVQAVLGELYAHSLAIRFLTAGVSDNAHSTDYAALRGKRLIVTSEVDKGQKLSTSKLKDLSGGDLAAFREIRQKAKDAARFVPTGKVWIYGNHDLAIPGAGTDGGLWRRFVRIESTHTFPHSAVRDGMVATEGAGILRVLVDAARAWYARNLVERPARLMKATAAYRDEQDTLGRFLRDCLVFEADAFALTSDVTRAYQEWCQTEGADYRVSPREMRQRLEASGGVEGHNEKRSRGWRGVRLRRPHEV